MQRDKPFRKLICRHAGNNAFPVKQFPYCLHLRQNQPAFGRLDILRHYKHYRFSAFQQIPCYETCPKVLWYQPCKCLPNLIPAYACYCANWQCFLTRFLLNLLQKCLRFLWLTAVRLAHQQHYWRIAFLKFRIPGKFLLHLILRKNNDSNVAFFRSKHCFFHTAAAKGTVIIKSRSIY